MCLNPDSFEMPDYQKRVEYPGFSSTNSQKSEERKAENSDEFDQLFDRDEIVNISEVDADASEHLSMLGSATSEEKLDDKATLRQCVIEPNFASRTTPKLIYLAAKNESLATEC